MYRTFSLSIISFYHRVNNKILNGYIDSIEDRKYNIIIFNINKWMIYKSGNCGKREYHKV